MRQQGSLNPQLTLAIAAATGIPEVPIRDTNNRRWVMPLDAQPVDQYGMVGPIERESSMSVKW